MSRFFIILFILLPLSILHSQDTIYVPGDYSTIQAAIDAASNGNVVLVAEDTYYENINFKGKAITVASHFILFKDTSHITNTIIDGSQPIYSDSASVVSFISGEDTNSVLCGFTLTGGTGIPTPTYRAGGGIVLYNSGAQIKNNIIEFNTITNVTWADGGGIFILIYNNSNIVVKNNIIQNNTCTGTDYALGGGISLQTNGHTQISNNKIVENSISANVATGGAIDIWGPINELYIISNLIKGNTVQSNTGGGGGIDIYECTTNTPVIENNVIVDNYSSVYGGGILVDRVLDDSFKSGLINPHSTSGSGDVLAEQYLTNNTLYNNSAGVSGGGIYTADVTSNIMNSILWGNTATSNPQISGTVNVEYSDVEGGWAGAGNIDLNPQFLDTTYFLLSNTSHCIDAGNPNPMYDDVEHIFNPGHPMPPASLTLRNDMGHCGGPNSILGYWQWPFLIDLPSTPILVSPAVGDTIISNQVTFSWEDSDPMVLRYLLELDTTDQFNDFFVDSVVIGNSLDYTGLEVDKNYYWRVRANNAAGWSDHSEVRTFNTFITSVSENDLLPDVFTLEQNYPNPFNPATTIKYQIPELSFVTIKVYDVLGNEINTLVNNEKSAGDYEVEFNASALPSGVYFYKIKAGDFVQVRKMMLLK